MSGSHFIIAPIAGIILLCSSCADHNKSPFIFQETKEGIELSEDGRPVYFYRRSPQEVPGTGVYNNYLHPVYNLKGEVITDEFPSDHLNHRGIFWAWHQVFINNKSVGDGWMMENLSQEVIKAETDANYKVAVLNMNVLWKSSLWQNGTAFIEEHTSVRVYKCEKNLRKIDFDIILMPLTSGIQIGGSNDEKGYGGFCTRIKMPDDLTFTSEKGAVRPQNLQIESGPWMDFCWTSPASGEKNGLAILGHPSIPNFPAPWILRQKGSMQNIVFPGRERIRLEQPIVLKYRVIIHNGDAKSADILLLQKQFNSTGTQ